MVTRYYVSAALAELLAPPGTRFDQTTVLSSSSSSRKLIRRPLQGSAVLYNPMSIITH